MSSTIPTHDPAYWQNPYPILAEFRERGATAYNDSGDLCVLRWDDAEWAIKGSDFINEGIERLENRGFQPGDPLHTWRSHALGVMEGPDHLRIRKLVTSTLSKRSLEPLRPMIRQHAHHLLDDLLENRKAGQPIDVLQGFAGPLPRRVMMSFLEVDGEEMNGAEAPLADARIPDCFGPQVTRDMRDTANRAIAQVMHHVGTLYEKRRQVPRDDFLTRLLEAEDEGGRLSHPELITLFSTIFGSGGTTGSAIASGLLELARHPEAAMLLRNDPPRWKQGACEETLRMRPGIVELPQKAAHPLEAFGHHFATGDTIAIPFGAANRDPDRWDNPQQFDITRDPRVFSLSFGLGAHFCIGQAMARYTIEEALATFVERVPDFYEAEVAQWTPFVMENRLQSLQLRVD
ncbi:cytochrome P450 [Parahaliea maris]|uniref:Cytochrome P450 n=1 Tax=Parahaliea maris TaxID=2716870 RepID=A0A5C9A5P9_9GAMM|nr:cytochrome P450 [Parahaliea maris]TXS96138.1 cytochrome P450 [Parahaliea maris]